MATHRSKNFVFYTIAILIPIALLAIIELALRAADYGQTYPLFVDAKSQPGYLQPNEEVINRFFAKPQFAPNVSPDTQFFLKEKPRDSYRIVVQGGSTAAGFPFGRWGSLSGMLQQRFKRLYPEKHIEIINTAMASVNTYSLLDFIDEIIAIEPDLVLIYAGHNEYLGVMGVGSAFASKGGRPATLLYLKLKEYKLYRLVESIYYRFFATSSAVEVDERTLMAKVAKEKEIPLGSELYQQGVSQFSGNLDLLLSKYQKANVNVLLGNLASNEKDQIPFSAIDIVTPKLVSRWSRFSNTQRNDRIEILQAQINGSNKEKDAVLHYELAVHLLNEGKHDVARQHFLKAKDKDLLRFRAPEDFNVIIQEMAEKYDYSLVDVQGNLREDSQDTIIGSTQMLEHLHPTARGYFLLADAYVDKIIELGYLGQPENQNEALAWKEMPITKADKLYGEFKVARLTSDYPFRNDPVSVDLPSLLSIEGKAVNDRLKGESWLLLNQKLSPIYQKNNDMPEAALISGLLADALPSNFDLAYVAGLINKKSGNLPIAIYYLTSALRLKPDSINTQLSLAQSYFLNGNPARSLEILQWVKSHKPDHPRINQLISTVQGRMSKG